MKLFSDLTAIGTEKYLLYSRSIWVHSLQSINTGNKLPENSWYSVAVPPCITLLPLWLQECLWKEEAVICFSFLRHFETFTDCHNKARSSVPYGFYEQTAYWSQVTSSFFLHILLYIIYSGTFPLGHPCSRDTSIQRKQQFGLGKTSTYSLPSVTSIEGRPLLRGKGLIFLVPKPEFNHYSWDSLALITWLTTKKVDIF